MIVLMDRDCQLHTVDLFDAAFKPEEVGGDRWPGRPWTVVVAPRRAPAIHVGVFARVEQAAALVYDLQMHRMVEKARLSDWKLDYPRSYR